MEEAEVNIQLSEEKEGPTEGDIDKIIKYTFIVLKYENSIQDQTKMSLKCTLLILGNSKSFFRGVENVKNLPALPVAVTAHLLHNNLVIKHCQTLTLLPVLITYFNISQFPKIKIPFLLKTFDGELHVHYLIKVITT